MVALARQVDSSMALPPEPSGTYFSVDLLAPSILRDPQGLPTLKLGLNFNGHWLEPVFWATQPTFVGGFSTAWGLPKPTYLAAATGSVYVFRVDKSPDDPTLLSWLESLEAQGVGQHTDEGLGEILICHPFHKEVMPV
jgi:CRISPR-associated protein Csx10